MSAWSTDDIEFIKRHTSYETDEIIIDKLNIHGSAINVIKHSFNIPKKSNANNIPITTSLNQEIYRQLRNKMECYNHK
jgi:ribosomal protein L31E